MVLLLLVVFITDGLGLTGLRGREGRTKLPVPLGITLGGNGGGLGDAGLDLKAVGRAGGDPTEEFVGEDGIGGGGFLAFGFAPPVFVGMGGVRGGRGGDLGEGVAAIIERLIILESEGTLVSFVGAFCTCFLTSRLSEIH